MPKLSKSELMALDLMIQVMKDEQLGIDVNEAAFIGGIVKITRRVVNVTRKITPVIKIATQVTPIVAGGTIGRSASSLQAAEENVEPEISLESLIALRNALSKQDE